MQEPLSRACGAWALLPFPECRQGCRIPGLGKGGPAPACRLRFRPSKTLRRSAKSPLRRPCGERPRTCHPLWPKERLLPASEHWQRLQGKGPWPRGQSAGVRQGTRHRKVQTEQLAELLAQPCPLQGLHLPQGPGALFLPCPDLRPSRQRPTFPEAYRCSFSEAAWLVSPWLVPVSPMYPVWKGHFFALVP